jgi:hypothetical protein
MRSFTMCCHHYVRKATKEGLGEKRNACKVFVGKPDENRPLRSRRTWDGNIKMDPKEQDARGRLIHVDQGSEKTTTKRVGRDVSM